VLGIETSTRRGSVAAVLDGTTVGAFAHEAPNEHAERLLALIELLLAEVGWTRTSIDRIAVGVGPGSFTGLRVGIALAQGIALGLDRPLVGVGSLAALASAVDASESRTRVPVLDARRSELFIAAYDAAGRELLAPSAVPIATAGAFVRENVAGSGCVLVGEAARLVGDGFTVLAGGELDLPHASVVARAGAGLDPAQAPVEPVYVRGPGATPQHLPPSPLAPTG
jgi:tRNA threonylcarbamoyladenosine biosynthesis protein TsaB